MKNGFKPLTACMFTINNRNKMHKTQINKPLGKAENRNYTDPGMSE